MKIFMRVRPIFCTTATEWRPTFATCYLNLFRLQHGPATFFVQCPGKFIRNMLDTQPNIVGEFYLDGVPTETFRQLCWNVLVDTLPI
jgi:hypothetical protein